MLLLNVEFDLEDYVDVVAENLRHWTNIKLTMLRNSNLIFVGH